MKNYFGYSFYIALVVFVLFLGIWFIPPFEREYVTLRRANILSALIDNAHVNEMLGLRTVSSYDFCDPELISASTYYLHKVTVPIYRDQPQEEVLQEKEPTVGVTQMAVAPVETTPIKPIHQRSQNATSTTLNQKHKTTHKSQPKRTSPPKTIAKHHKTETHKAEIVSSKAYVPVKQNLRTEADPSVKSAPLTPVEMAENGNYKRFISKLKSGQKVRIAVVGDSFIEGDIFTQDLRENLQKRFGGNGVGYVPITSNVAGFRQSVRHTFSGWTTKCVLNNPSSATYHLAGYVFTPSEGAWVHYKGSNFRAGLSRFSSASLFFVNEGNSKITVTINDTITQTFNPSSSAEMQRIVVQDNIASVRFKVNNVTGLKVYGALLGGGNGVSVDNYSVRSYSGAGLANIRPDLIRQTDPFMHYDLVIVQYGLNVASANVTKYSNYARQMVGIVEHLKDIMPQTAIMVMSISDRQNRNSGDWSTMPGVIAMEETQRGVAKQCGVPFWSTMQAMKKNGGMNHFVKKGWAAKDYTHLASTGGKVVATQLVNAILD